MSKPVPPALSPAEAAVPGRAPASGLTPAEHHTLASLPVSPLRTNLLLLDPAARERALRQLTRLQVPREDLASLRVTLAGRLYYVCDFPSPAASAPAQGALIPRPMGQGIPPPPPGPVMMAMAPPPTMAAAAVPISAPPLRHSRPGATKVIFLDFNGHTITGTSWNDGGAPATYVARPYDSDGDSSTFSDAEQAVILNVWSRVAEDFAPFDVDVTTEEPAVFTRTTAHGLITPNVDANGVALPSSSAGGVALLGVFGEADFATMNSPAFAYSNNLGATNPANIAEAVSHELGHNFGLNHDGRIDDPVTPADDPSEYYGGHGSTEEISWGPIMGTGYGRNVSQWSKGEYYRGNNAQDDFVTLSGHLGYRTDEAGATLLTASPAPLSVGAINAPGVIAHAADTDLFVFNAGAGPVNLTATPFIAAAGTRGGNTDLKLELLDAAGTVLATTDPAATTGASFSHTVSAGRLYVRLTGVGAGDPLSSTPTGYTSYGTAGQYTLTGTFTAAAPAIVGSLTASTPAGALFNYGIAGTNAPTSYGATGLPSGLTLDSSTGVISGRPTVVGVFPVTLSATNALGPATETLTLTVTDAAPVITLQTTGRQSVGVTGSLTLSVTVLSANGTPTYQWRRNGQVLAGATAATLTLSPATMAQAGVYRVDVTNNIGPTRSAPVFVQVVPFASGITGWGNGALGQTTPPAGLTDAIAIAAGGSHALALKSDGTVVAWGDNAEGQATVPAGLTDVVAIAAAAQVSGSSPPYSYSLGYSLALKADGTLVGWGNNDFEQLDFPPALTGVMAIAAGTYHALALKADGTVVAWGNNSFDQTEVPAGLTDVVAIACGNLYSLAVKADGTVVAWGDNGNGVLNVPAGLANAIGAAGGVFHSVAIKADGTVANWGFASYGAAPGGFNTGRQLAAGYRHTVALKADGTVAAWGNNTDGQTTVPGGITHAFQVAASAHYSLALRETIIPVAQTITFAGPADQPFTTAPLSLSATASSGLTVSFSVLSGPATVSGNALTLTGVGTVVIRASQAGDGTYGAAMPVDRTLVVSGSFASWLLSRFTAPERTDALISGPNADPDADGISNLIEYALDLAPKTPNGSGLPEVSTTVSDWVYTYARPADRTDLTCTVEASTDLVTWSTSGVTHELVSASGGIETWRARYPLASAARVFFRLKVVQ